MIVVTGGAGFIGSNLINFLGNQDSQEVISVDWKNDENTHYFENKLITILPEKIEFASP